jgi:glycosyltransferase involved in cell wall biosynthesis
LPANKIQSRIINRQKQTRSSFGLNQQPFTAIVLPVSVKKIAIALDYPLTLRGGVGVIVESLLKYLPSEYSIILVSPDEHRELQRHPSFARIQDHVCFNPAGLTPVNARDFAQTMGRYDVSLMHFHAGANLGWGNRSGRKSPLPFLSRAGIPSIFSAHQVSPLLEGYCAENRSVSYKLALLPAVWLASTYALSFASQIVTDSKHDALLLKRHHPTFAKKIDFFYHSRLDALPADAAPAGGRETTILSVGHIAFRKGQHILAEAFSKIAPKYPEWKLVIAGPVIENACAEKIRQIIAIHGLQKRVLMLGSHSAPSELMQRAAIFVQPSLMEAFGLALQEAMFFGCACIGTDTGGIPELIAHNRTGLLCSPDSAGALARVLDELLRDPKKRLELAEAAHAEILQKGMTGQAMAANYDRIYRRILQSRE